jgi:PPOX class probable F420-dependent enzyme
MSRRDQITMSDDEVTAFLDESKVVVVATNGRDGFPHQMPLWFVVRDGDLLAWTYAKSQKIKNLERDPRATLTVETGTEYQELRGVMLKCDVTLLSDTEQVAEVGLAIFSKYSGGPAGELAGEVREMVLKQATKRVAMRFAERERATWDHRKLGSGVY